MFENDAEVDLDDEFLNIVFENEASRGNINQHTKLSNNIGLLAECEIPSTSRKCVVDAQDPSVTDKSFNARSGLLSNCSENFFTNFSCDRNIQQGGFIRVGETENKRKASPPPSRAKRERKFPGPAGLLPDRKGRGTPLKLNSLLEVESPSATSDELCSQGRLSGSVLEEGPWQSFLSDLGPHADLLEVVNVARVKRKAAARCFVGRKLPFLAAVLHHLDVSSADPCCILRDSTGEIHGTLHRDVWQQFAAELVIGSVLVIRNVGLLSTGLSSRRHYLNITANNLATIYSANPDKPQKKELHCLTSQDYRRTVEHWQMLVPTPRSADSPASSLFNTSLPSTHISTPSPAQSPQLNLRPRLSGPTNPVARPSTSQNTQGCRNQPVISPYSRANPPLRPMGKVLFPSCSNSNQPNSAQRLSSNNISPLINRPHNSVVNKQNPNVNHNNFNNSFSSQIRQKDSRNVNNGQVTNSSAPGFKFDPVILKTPSISGNIPNNFKQDTSCRRENNITRDKNARRNSIILSQSSQLTLEEQSVVESVLDGIDVDSLFNDDF